MPLGILVEPRRLDGRRHLSCRRTQGLDLAPVGAPLIRAVIADLEHACRMPAWVHPERHEDADQISVAAFLEHLARQREGRARGVFIRVSLTEKARAHGGHDPTVRPHHRHLGPPRCSRDRAAHNLCVVG